MSGNKVRRTEIPGVYAYALASGETRYAAMATVRGKQRWSQGHRTPEAALQAKTRLAVDLERGRGTRRDTGLTLAAYLRDRWLPARHNVSDGTRRAYRVEIDRICALTLDQGRSARPFGAYPLARITPEDIERFVARLARTGLSPTSQNHTYVRLAQALGHAVRLRLIADNPCDLVEPPRKGSYQPVQLSVEQIKTLLAVAEGTAYGTLVYLALATGMREGELFALCWSDIDFAGGTLSIRRSKTRSGQRAVALGPLTLERLRQHRLAQMKRFEELKADAPRLVFVSEEGLPMRQASFWPHWQDIRSRAGLGGMHFHDLRHAQATLLARAGIHPSVSQHRLGHSDARLTLDVYTHVNAADQEPAARAIEEMLRG